MPRSILRWAALSIGAVLLAVSVLAAVPAAAKQAGQQSGTPTTSSTQAEQGVTANGKVAVVTTNGHKQFVLQDASGKTTYNLKFGPPWFADSSANPLNKYVNQQATVTGAGEQADKGTAPNAQPASSKVPMLNVRTINGQNLLGTGRPPWAGGPKNVPGHPGSNGNGHSQGQGQGNGKGKSGTKP